MLKYASKYLEIPAQVMRNDRDLGRNIQIPIPQQHHACRLPCTQPRSAWWMEGRFRSSNPCLPFCANNAFCRLDSAWCIGLYIVCVHHDVNACAYTHIQRYVCMSSFELHTFAGGCTDSTVYRYSTLADQTVHFDNNYTQNHHPVPFLCPWPVRDCGGHQICCQANFTFLVLYKVTK
jgi:hypothetical protein